MRSIKPGRGPSKMAGFGSLFAAGFGVLWTLLAASSGALHDFPVNAWPDAAARRAAFLLGGTVRGTVDAPIPRRADWAHVLLLTDKTGTTPKAYPRRAGTPGKKPLGM